MFVKLGIYSINPENVIYFLAKNARETILYLVNDKHMVISIDFDSVQETFNASRESESNRETQSRGP